MAGSNLRKVEDHRGTEWKGWTGRTVRATGGGACQAAMSAEVASADAAAAVVAETAVAVEIAAERTVEGTKDRLKTWYGSERPCVVVERNWASVEGLKGGKEHKEGKKNGRRRR